jgi:hypothetical protein
MEIVRVMAPSISMENVPMVITRVVSPIGAILNAPQKRAWWRQYRQRLTMTFAHQQTL